MKSEDAISRQAVEEIINDIRDCISVEGYWAILERLKKLPSVSTEKTALLEQVRWERDVAISQLHELGYEFGEKIEQQPCTDVISRQAAIDAVGLSRIPSKIKGRIADLPPVSTEKTGRWILKRTSPTKLYDEHLKEYKCSECYRGIRCTESQLVNYPYCHCGAKMVEPQESEGDK